MKKIALAGVAHIHAPNFVKRLQERSGIEVVSLWDHDRARAERYAKEIGCRICDLLRNPPAAYRTVLVQNNIHGT